MTARAAWKGAWAHVRLLAAIPAGSPLWWVSFDLLSKRPFGREAFRAFVLPGRL